MGVIIHLLSTMDTLVVNLQFSIRIEESQIQVTGVQEFGNAALKRIVTAV